MIIMKKILYLTMICSLLLGFSSCDKDEDIITPSASGTMQDKEGNEYKWVRIGNMDWMAENLHCGTPFYELAGTSSWGSLVYLYQNYDQKLTLQYEKDFGNYYDYQQALDYCPDGWRLPSDEDWKRLEIALGMKSSDADKLGWRDGAGLQLVDKQGVALLYGGQLCKWGYGSATDGTTKAYQMYDTGLYWTSTVDPESTTGEVFYRKIFNGRNQVERRTINLLARYMCVRYVRDAK